MKSVFDLTLTCYTSFDKKYLPFKVSRNRANSQTMMGQFYFFVTDTLYGTFIFLAFAPGMNKISHNGKDIAVFVKNLEFGIVSVVQCLLIPELRRKMFNRTFKSTKALWILAALGICGYGIRGLDYSRS